MKINLGHFMEVGAERINRMLRDLEIAFEDIPENVRRTYDVTLDFSAPAAVPGKTTQSVTIDGAEVGDTVLVGAPVAAPAGFIPPVGHVSAANTIVISWLQLSGAAADPDGAGGTYRVDLFRH